MGKASRGRSHFFQLKQIKWLNLRQTDSSCWFVFISSVLFSNTILSAATETLPASRWMRRALRHFSGQRARSKFPIFQTGVTGPATEPPQLHRCNCSGATKVAQLEQQNWTSGTRLVLPDLVAPVWLYQSLYRSGGADWVVLVRVCQSSSTGQVVLVQFYLVWFHWPCRACPVVLVL